MRHVTALFAAFGLLTACAAETSSDSEKTGELHAASVIGGFRCPSFGWWCGDGVNTDSSSLFYCNGSQTWGSAILLDSASGGAASCTLGCNPGPANAPAFCNGGGIDYHPPLDPGFGWWCGSNFRGGLAGHLYFFDQNGYRTDLGPCRNNHCITNSSGPDYCEAPPTDPCPGGVLCGGRCVSTANDNSNCGGCGVVCRRGSHCSNGSCLCPDGSNNTITNANDCGQCGHRCDVPAGQICQSAQCGCPGTETYCPELFGPHICADTFSDPSNCGDCGHVCIDGNGFPTACVVGQCL